jgi:hypothetical protein
VLHNAYREDEWIKVSIRQQMFAECLLYAGGIPESGGAKEDKQFSIIRTLG